MVALRDLQGRLAAVAAPRHLADVVVGSPYDVSTGSGDVVVTVHSRGRQGRRWRPAVEVDLYDGDEARWPGPGWR